MGHMERTGGVRTYTGLLCFNLILHLLPVHSQDTPLSRVYTLKEDEDGVTILGELKKELDFTNVPATFRFLSPGQPIVNYFSLNPSSGELAAVKAVDREVVCGNALDCEILLDIIVNNPPDVAIVKVSVIVEDKNDHEPEFDETRVNIQIPEGTSINTVFPLATVKDEDSGTFGIQELTLSPQNAYFAISSRQNTDGSREVELVVRGDLDRETTSSYDLGVTARDGGTPAKSSTLTIRVEILDSNDHTPTFENATYRVKVPENTPDGSTVLVVKATDPDTGANGGIIYNFSKSTLSQYSDTFAINAITGRISFKKPVDREALVSDDITLSVSASDSATPPLTGYAIVTVTISDMNDNRPLITLNPVQNNHVKIPEHSPVGTFVAHIGVRDPDLGDNGRFNCSLNSTRFNFAHWYENDYKITTSVVFDREEHSQYLISLICTDYGSPRLSTARDIAILIDDINDNPPLFKFPIYNLSVAENNPLRKFLAQIQASDADVGDNAKLTYSIYEQGSGAGIGSTEHDLSVDPLTGAIYTNREFDHELQADMKFVLKATDNGVPPRSSTTVIHLSITDLNDEPPRFNRIPPFGTLENQPPGTKIGIVNATDPDGPTYNVVNFVLTPGHKDNENFTIDSKTGVIYTRRSLDHEFKSEYILHVTAFNPGWDLSSTAIVTVAVADVNDNGPVFTYPEEEDDYIELTEVKRNGDILVTVTAEDKDSGANGDVRYSLVYGNEAGLFFINTQYGDITFTRDMDLGDYGAFHSLVVLAQDRGSQPLSATAQLYIRFNVSYEDLVERVNRQNDSNSDIPIIAISIIAFLLVCAIIVAVAIFYVQRYRQRMRRAQMLKYNCKVEVVTVGDAAEARQGQGQPQPEHQGQDLIQTVHQRPRMPSPKEVYWEGGGQGVGENRNNASRELNEIQLQVHDMLGHMDANQLDLDTSSATDSGKGSSEGDHHDGPRGSPLDPTYRNNHRPISTSSIDDTTSTPPRGSMLLPPLTTRPYYRLGGDVGVVYNKPLNNSNCITSIYPTQPNPSTNRSISCPPSDLAPRDKAKKSVHFSHQSPSPHLTEAPQTLQAVRPASTGPQNSILKQEPRHSSLLKTFQPASRDTRSPNQNQPDLLMANQIPAMNFAPHGDSWGFPGHRKSKFDGSECSGDIPSDSETTTSGSYCMDDADFDILV